MTLGIEKDEYADRRKQLLQQLEPSSAAVILGYKTRYATNNILYVISLPLSLRFSPSLVGREGVQEAGIGFNPTPYSSHVQLSFSASN